MAVLNLAILLFVVLGLAYVRVPVRVWTIAIGVTLIAVTIAGQLNILFLAISWIMYIIVAVFANVTGLRLRFITIPIFNKLQKNMPPISDSEREAIEAGHVWWEKELFCGRPSWKKLFGIPKPELTEEEQAFLENQVEILCNMVNDWQVVKDHDLPTEVWSFIKEEGFFGLVIPKKYGGHGFSALAHSTIIMKLATRSISLAVNTMVPNSLGPGELLYHYGTEEQKNYYLPRLSRGEEIPCFALTGPTAGSDAGSLTDFGIVCKGEWDGQEIIGIRLTWDKRYITLAPISTVLGIAFRLYDPDHLIGDKEDYGITLGLVPVLLPGVEIGNRHLPLTLAFMNGPTRGKDVFIPLDCIIGGIEMAGHGWKMLMECLSIGRSISLPALSTACGKMAYRLTGGYSLLRRQFNVPIAQFEGIEEFLGDIAGFTYILESTRVMTAGAVDLGLRPAIASAIAKYHMTEMARTVIEHAMDIHAGHGIQMGPRNILANAHIGIPISITVEGANMLTRCLIIFGQGAIRCHPYILDEMTVLSEPDNPEKINKIDRLLLSHIGYAFSNLVRSFWFGLTGGLFILSPVRGKTARLYKQITRMSAALALLSDMTMLLLGGSLKRKERTSARLGDLLSQLYLATAVLKYYKDQGQPKTDIGYVHWCVEYSLYKIQSACDELLNNFPSRLLGKILYGIIFPWGVAYRKPRDVLYHNIVSEMLQPNEFRNRLSSNCFVSQNSDDPLNRIETAFLEVQNVEPLLKKFQGAVKTGTVPAYGSLSERLQAGGQAGVFTIGEMETLSQFFHLYEEVIKVNEFSFDFQTVVS